jgi:hypothetical protein
MSKQAYPESRLRGLTPWKPGQSGNTKGRKKGLMTLIREALERDEIAGQKTPDGRSVIEHYAEAIIAHGMKGNAAYMAQVFDRLEGKTGVEEGKTASEGVVYVERASNPRDLAAQPAPKAVGPD